MTVSASCEGSVCVVVYQEACFPRSEFQLGLLHAETFDHVAREVPDAHRVLKAVMRPAREDVVERAELLEVAQPLELRRVNETHAESI